MKSRTAGMFCSLLTAFACGSEHHGGPAAPTGVSAVPANDAAAVSWSPIAGVTTYNVYFASAAQPSTSSSKITVPGPPATVSGLTNGKVTYLAVSAVSATGESPLSSTVCAVPTVSSGVGLTLYDPLCGPALDGSKWQGPGLSSIGVSAGAAVLGVDVANQPSRTVRGDQYTSSITVNSGSERVTSLGAEITVPAATATRSGSSQIRAVVRLLYSPPQYRLNFPAANLHLLVLEVGLIDVGNGPQAFRQMSHCNDAPCANFSADGVSFTDPPGFAAIGGGLQSGAAAAYDTSYGVSATFDESTGLFHWTISGGAFGGGVDGSADPSAYLAATPGWSGTPLAGSGFQSAQLSVRTMDLSTAGGGSGKITVRLKNARVGMANGAATPYDDFSGANGNSGPLELSATKWRNGGGTSAMLSEGSLVLRSQLTNASNAVASSVASLTLGNPSANTLQADVSVPASGSTGGANAPNNSVLQGSFYNDGSPGATPPNVNQPNSLVGDVLAAVFVHPVTNDAIFFILRCTTTACGAGTLVGQGPIPGATVGTGVHTVLLKWDPAATTFTFGVDGNKVEVNPTVASAQVTSPAAVAGPARSPFKRVFASVVNGNNTTRVNNVFTAP